MDFQVRISNPALADYILEYSWANSPANAESFGNAILNHIDLLKTFPFIGNPVAGRVNVRQLVHTPIRIYDSVREGPNVIEILHFWHFSRKEDDTLGWIGA